MKTTDAHTNAQIIPDYSRQLSVKGMSAARQQKLERARVLLVGAGGLGVTASSYLAAAGVAALTIQDDDHIEASNLHRQTIFTFADLGNNKARTAVAYLRQRTHNCQLTAVAEKANLHTLLPLVENHDVILDCTDDFACSYLINDLAWHTGTPAVFANAAGMHGQLFVLNPRAADAAHDHACLRCIWQQPPANAGNTCNIVGVLGPVPGILGCMQAIEAIKLITAFQPAVHNRLLNYRLDTHRLYDVRVTPHHHCCHDISSDELHQRHGDTGSFAFGAMTADEAAQVAAQHYGGSLAKAVQRGWQVIDIRSDAEIRAQPIAEATQHTPMQRLLAAPEQHLHAQQPCILVCSTGKRSRAAISQLRRQNATRFGKLYFYP